MEIATITIKRVPFDGGYSFDVERAGVPLEDLAIELVPPFGTIDVHSGLAVIGKMLDEIEQAGP